MQRIHWFLYVATFSMLAGCASSTLQQSLSAALRGDLYGTERAIANAPLNPSYRYLRVDVDGSASALLVLGYTEPHTDGLVEVWYSSVGEVIKLQQGRIVGTVGLPVDWSSVSYVTSPPALSAVSGQTFIYERLRNVLPSYRFRVTERVVVTPVPQPVKSQLPFAVFGGGFRVTEAPRYRWYREQVTGVLDTDLPSSWFALGSYSGREAVVFSRQCLASNVCMNLQLWPVQGVELKP